MERLNYRMERSDCRMERSDYRMERSDCRMETVFEVTSSLEMDKVGHNLVLLPRMTYKYSLCVPLVH